MIGRATKLLHLLAFAGLAFCAALLVNRSVEPNVTADLLLAAALGIVAGIPGLVRRRLVVLFMPLAAVLAYLLARLVSPLPPNLEGPSAQLGYYLEELRYGMVAYTQEIFPLTLTGAPGLRLLVLLWVYTFTAGAAVLGLGARRVLGGVGALLGLMAFSLTVDRDLREPWAILGFLMLVVVVLLTSEALSRRRLNVRDAVLGLGVGGLALLLGFGTLQGLPGVAKQGWQDWESWDPFGTRAGGTFFNWNQNYPRLLDPGNKFPIFRVVSPDPTYWRANVLDVFTGSSWLSSDAFDRALPAGPGPRPVPARDPVPPGRYSLERFELVNVSTSYLFTGANPTALELGQELPIFCSAAGALRSAVTVHAPFSYTVKTVFPTVQPKDLVALGRHYPQGVRQDGLALPLPSAEEVRQLRAAGQDWLSAVASSPDGSEFADLYDLNDRVVGEATDPYEQALLIEQFLRSSYHYSLAPRKSAFRSPYAAFLFDTRTGYCQHFAGAMALLLRLNGVPARVAVGFTTGDSQGADTYLVSSNNAHSWVEVYFPRIGWLPFDPTPDRTLPGTPVSTASAGFENPYRHPQSSSPATSSPPESTRLPPQGSSHLGRTSSADGGMTRPVAAYAALGCLIVLVGWPLVRNRVRGRALRSGSHDQRLVASFQLLRADLANWGLPPSPGATVEELASFLRHELAVDASPMVIPLNGLLYGGHGAGKDDLDSAEQVRSAVRRGLRRRRGWLRALAAWYGAGGLLTRISTRRREVLSSETLGLWRDSRTSTTGAAR